jgi:hypothetical protein
VLLRRELGRTAPSAPPPVGPMAPVIPVILVPSLAGGDSPDRVRLLRCCRDQHRVAEVGLVTGVLLEPVEDAGPPVLRRPHCSTDF